MRNLLAEAATLKDANLLEHVAVLAGCERQSTVALIGYLAELDKRRLYLGEGFASLFSYCTKALRLSEQAAYKRIVAARASRRFPILLERLASGSINLSSVCLLAPILTDDNHMRLLAEARERSKREVEILVARLAPKPDVAASVRRLPTAPPFPPVPAALAGLLVQAANNVPYPTPTAQSAAFTDTPPQAQNNVSNRAAPHASKSWSTEVHPSRRPEIVPLTPERYRIQFTVSRETQEKLRRIQDLLRREIPDGDPAAIFERALTLLLEDISRKKLAATTSPRPLQDPDPRSRYVPAEVKRKVWLRDGGRCAFVTRGGRRCAERALLEFHHVEPYSAGGETTVDNLSLRCRSHNRYEAELLFGPFQPQPRRMRDC